MQLLAASALGTAVTLAALARVAPAWGLIDHPGGRKDHAHPVPVVGGIALAITLFVGELWMGSAVVPSSFLTAAAVLVLVSVLDDLWDLHHAPRFAGQIVAALLMVFWAGIELHSVGDILGWRPIGTWALSVPITVFAVVGVINALNMLDGMDGLAGSVSLVALAWYGYAATASGLPGLFGLAWLLCGALFAFLAFNLRLPWRKRAHVFLGDAGSTLLGFTLAWFAIDLTQGEGRSMPPIAALWVVLLPLADTVSLMARRIRRGHSPFHPDREHIHHFLLSMGFSVNGALAILVAVSALFGAVGVVGWRLGVPEPVLFYAFAALFFAYHFAISRAWRSLHARHVRGPRQADARTT